MVDGDVWFDGNSGHRANLRPEHLVAYASDSQMMMPGDVLGTGTVGLDCSMEMGKWPQVGQTFTIEIEGIGSLTHPIVAGEEVVSYIGNGMDGQVPVPPGVAPSAA